VTRDPPLTGFQNLKHVTMISRYDGNRQFSAPVKVLGA
jgi:hypothetical protein